MVNGITFSEQLITSENFAHFMHTFLNHANGVTKGCSISHAKGSVFIQKGYFIQFGRFVQVVGVEEAPSPEVLSGELYCSLVFEIDLSKSNTADAFNQGCFKTLASADGYPALRQEDLDDGGSVYQMPWCRYVKKEDGISEFRDMRPILDLDSVWPSVAEQNEAYKKEFDEFFEAQKASIEGMIQELEGEGYVLLSEQRRTLTAALPASGWEGEAAPYTQTVSVPGLRAEDSPVMVMDLADDLGAEGVKAYKKAYAMIESGQTGDGTATFQCRVTKPTVDLTVGLKGV